MIKRWFLVLIVFRVWLGYNRFLMTFRGWHGMNGWHQQTLWMLFCYTVINGTENFDSMKHIYHDGSKERVIKEGWLW